MQSFLKRKKKIIEAGGEAPSKSALSRLYKADAARHQRRHPAHRAPEPQGEHAGGGEAGASAALGLGLVRGLKREGAIMY